MNVERSVKFELPTSIITGVTLLTIEDVKQLSKKTRTRGYWWWLRSPGEKKDLATNVYGNGYIYERGSSVSADYGGVLPALTFDSDLQLGDKIEINGYAFTVVLEGLALADQPIGCYRFDAKSNNYESSDIKRYLEDWLVAEIRPFERGQLL